MTPPRRASGIPLRSIPPNAITALALCFGLTGVLFAIKGDWEKALASVVFAGVLDGMDGRIARLLRANSRFGAELDSLSDVTAFGVAPTLIMFLWSLQHAPKFGWIAALAMAVCCSARSVCSSAIARCFFATFFCQSATSAADVATREINPKMAASLRNFSAR